MKRVTKIILAVQLLFVLSNNLFSQTNNDKQDFGIAAGAFTNFPANQYYLKEYINVIYIAPYLLTGKHEFSAGLVFPLTTHGLFYNDNNINPCLGFMAGYKFFVFDIYGRENLFVHYLFQYLRFKGSYDIYYSWSNQPFHWTETDTYINNVIGLGYNLYFDNDERFGLYYTLDYVISQPGYKLDTPGFKNDSWTTKYIWNNISTNFGFIFKLTSLKKKTKG